MPDAPEGDSLPARRSVGERAAQRDRMQRAGRDRYSSLMHTLHAGQELPWQQPRPQSRRLAWHPIAWKLLRVAVIAVLLWIGITTALGLWRDVRVDVWSGPDASVTSGQRLADCPLVGRVTDSLFPNWIRYDAKIFLLTDTIRPMGFEPDADFPPTGYSHGSMALYRVAITPEGQAGRIVVVKFETSAVGQVYRLAPDCS